MEPVRRVLMVLLGVAMIGACTASDGGEGSDGDEDEGTATTAAAAPTDLGDPVPAMTLAFYAADFGPEFQQASRILADDFEQLGLTVELAPVQQSTFVDTISTGGQLEDIALGSWGGDPDRVDPNFWLVDVSSCDGSRNGPKWCDPEYDEIALAQSVVLDEEERLQLVYEAQEYHHSQLPWWLVESDNNAMLYNSERWTNVTDPAPISADGSSIKPWLDLEPTGDDRILDMVMHEDVSSYNIFIEQSALGWIRLLHDTFLRDDQGEMIPWAAESFEAIDDTTIELTLREGMTFHDGEPVTVDDAVFSINYAKEHEPPHFAVALERIEDAEAVDDRTLRINLTEPDAAFFRASLGFLPIVPQHVWEDVEDPLTYDVVAEDAVIGSGPFVFESWAQGQEHMLSVHEDHWEAPAYDGIRKATLGQADAVAAAMVSGDGDFTHAVIPVAEMDRIANENDHLDFIDIPSHSSTMVWVNNEKEPFNDYDFRLALRMATDKERIANEAWLGFATAAQEGPIPPIIDEWHNPDLEPIPYDIEGARQVLEDAGYGWDDQGALHFPAGG